MTITRIRTLKGCQIVRVGSETLAVFLNGNCIASGFSTFNDARAWVLRYADR